MVTLEGAHDIVVKDLDLWIVNVAVADASQPGTAKLLVSFKGAGAVSDSPLKICALTDEACIAPYFAPVLTMATDTQLCAEFIHWEAR